MIKSAWEQVTKCECNLSLHDGVLLSKILLHLLFVLNIHYLAHCCNNRINHRIFRSSQTNFSMIFCIWIHHDISAHLSIDFHSFWCKVPQTKNLILQVNSSLLILSCLEDLMIYIISLHMKCASFYSILFTILRIYKLQHVLLLNHISFSHHI
jgi:hypothetical protein